MRTLSRKQKKEGIDMQKCLLFLVLFSLAAVAWGQCGPSGCPVEEWKEIEGDPGRVYLYRAGRQVGGWDYDAGFWRSYDARADRWGEPVKSAPSPPPDRRVVNYGVDRSKLGGSPYQLNGKPATRREIDAAIGSPLPDDSKKFRLVATGEAAERQRIADAWQPMEPEVKARVAVWSVPASHWSLQDTVTGKSVFRAGGLTFQAPDGKVLHRQADFTGSEDFAAIRKAIRAYDAEKDPDLRTSAPLVPSPAPMPQPLLPAPAPTNTVPPWLALLAITAIHFFLQKRGP
jgi:hypothetical protein